MAERLNIRKSNGGFALVELLVSITLLALLTVLLSGALRLGSRAAASGEKRLDRTTQLAVAESVLLAQLAGALPVAAPGSNRMLFDGTADSVGFAGLPPAYLAPGGFHRLNLAAEPAGKGVALVLRWQSLSSDDDKTLHPSVLVDGLEQVRFAYYGARDYAEAPQWRDDWHEALRLPALIRLHLIFPDHRFTPDLVVALRLSQATREFGDDTST